MKKFVTVIVAGLLLAACAAEDSGDTTIAPTTPAPETTVAETTPPTTAAPATTASADTTTPPDDSAGAEITIAGSSFGGPVTVSVGETVEVTNTDAIPHTWTSETGVFNSGSLGQGDSFSFTFEEAGTYPFICSIHPSMTGTVTVEG